MDVAVTLSEQARKYKGRTYEYWHIRWYGSDGKRAAASRWAAPTGCPSGRPGSCASRRRWSCVPAPDAAMSPAMWEHGPSGTMRSTRRAGHRKLDVTRT